MQPEGSEISHAAFIKSLRGEAGKDGYEGRDGIDGKSAYDIWAEHQPEDKRSYQLWMETLKGEPGKNGDEWTISPDGFWCCNGIRTDRLAIPVPAKDGKSAYEVWAERQPEDKRSYQQWIEELKGKDGIGHDGEDGNDGDTWKPYLSQNGILYFENTRTHERTAPQNISGLQGPGGDPGANGETWRPVITDDGAHLYFINDKGEKTSEYPVKGATGNDGKQGPDGLSAYDIWIKEGHSGEYHDFLLWIAQQAEKGEDGDTFEPSLENGCLIFTSKKTGEKSNVGNVIGPKGEKGDQGLNGHNIRHEYDYQDLMNYECPIQTMMPRLITSTTDLGSGISAREHMEQALKWIKNIRKAGENNHGSWIQEFFWWCAGADRALLRMCPAEHSKYMGIGTVIFFTALMAWFSSFTAMKLVFGEDINDPKGIVILISSLVLTAFGLFTSYKGYKKNSNKLGTNGDNNQQENHDYSKGGWGELLKIEIPQALISIVKHRPSILSIIGVLLCIAGIVGIIYSLTRYTNVYSALFATFWSAMIFFLDRFITNTMYSDGKVTISWLEIRSALPRILIAIFLGIVISAPLELKIFDKEINDYIGNFERGKWEERLKDESCAELNNEYSKMSIKKKALDDAEEEYQRIKHLTKQEKEDLFFKDEKNDKRDVTKGRKWNEQTKSWQPVSSESNTAVYTRIYDSKAYQAECTNDSIACVNAKNDYLAYCDTFALKFDSLIKSFNKDDIIRKAGLYDRLQALHSIAFKEGSEDGYKPWKTWVYVVVKDTVKNDMSDSVKVAINKPVKNNSVSSDSIGQSRIKENVKNDSISSDPIVQSRTKEITQDDSSFTIKKKYVWNNSIGNPFYWFIGIFAFLAITFWQITPNVTKKEENEEENEEENQKQGNTNQKEQQQEKAKEEVNSDNSKTETEDKKKLLWQGIRILWPCFAAIAFVCAVNCDTLFNALPYYLFSAVGLIMMLFIIIDVSPVFYKMMLADGQYEQYLHKEKSVTQDLIRLDFAGAIAKVNSSEVAKLAPMIFSKPWKKVKAVLKAMTKMHEDVNRGEGTKKPELSYGTNVLEEAIDKKNKEIFDHVLQMKQSLIMAAYQAWYRDMRDCLIGSNASYKPDPDDPSPFTPEDHLHVGTQTTTPPEDEKEADEEPTIETDEENEESDKGTTSSDEEKVNNEDKTEEEAKSADEEKTDEEDKAENEGETDDASDSVNEDEDKDLESKIDDEQEVSKKDEEPKTSKDEKDTDSSKGSDSSNTADADVEDDSEYEKEQPE
jgi:hypothetical protein